MKQLWVKKYAPATFEEYCFANKQMRQTIQKLLAENDIPHMLLTGAAGSGKCLDFNEHIDVQIDISTLTDDQLKKLEPYKPML